MSEHSYRILLVDDDEEDFFFLKDLVSEIHDTRLFIDWVPKYEDALNLILEKRYDAYLVDYRLGEKTGLDLLLEVGEKGIKAPFILLTGYGDHRIDNEAMKLGVSDYLVKGHVTAPLLERAIRYSINRHLAVLQLKEREESIRSLFNATFEAIIVHELNGKILDVNDTAGHLFDHKRETMIETLLTQYFPSEVLNKMMGISSSGSSEVFRTSCRKLDGTKLNVEVSTKRYYYKGRLVWLTTCRDLSERMELEAQVLQQDRLASIGLLASSLAHEIGTPLGVIRGRAEYLDMVIGKDPEAHKIAGIIISQIDRVTKLIQSLLSLARGSGSQSTAPVKVSQVIEDVFDLMGHEFKKNNINFINSVSDDVLVKADQGPLHQVFLNLFVNALHAIESTASSSTRQEKHFLKIYTVDKGQKWQLCVEDSGCGIAEENLNQLFKPFYTTKEVGVGTGLGLATSYRIIESWGGNISVKSEVNKGTIFILTLEKR